MRGLTKKARVRREGESAELGLCAGYSTPFPAPRFAADSSDQIPGAALKPCAEPNVVRDRPYFCRHHARC
jgi:hypothetical protein